LIARSIFSRHSLEDQVAVVTGAGRGIGLETARSLAWLGARVVIAEVDPQLGHDATAQINREFDYDSSVFVRTDVGNEDSVIHLARQVIRLHGRVDIILNNAVTIPVGLIQENSIRVWDHSYHVNLRGPVLLVRMFLPAMLQQDSGVIAFVASTARKYCAVSETMKSAQIALAHNLDAEVEKSSLITFTIHPGRVLTSGAESVERQIASLEGQNESLDPHFLGRAISAETSGAAIAASIALASRYRGLDIDVYKVLRNCSAVAGRRPN